MKVDHFEPIRSRLRELAATRLGEVLETNAFFDTADHALLREDRGLRLRTNRDVDTNRSEHVITYKGARQAGAMKAREEREVDVDDPAAAASIFEALGYRAELTFEKRRESWKLGNSKVELDELPILGKFVEVEGPSDAVVEAVRGQLRLKDHPHIADSYIAMLMDHVKRSGAPVSVIRFS